MAILTRTTRYLLLVALTACASTAWGAPATREPHIGYLFPAGGQRGSVFEVIAGGQLLRGPSDVYVSGEGVSARVIQHYRPPTNLDREERRELQKQVRDLRKKRLDELKQQGRDPGLPGWVLRSWGLAPRPNAEQDEAEEAEAVEVPDHPLLRDLQGKSLRQLQNVWNELLNWQIITKRQRNAQLAEMVLIEVTIDADATPGNRELRLGAAFGLSNPMCFQVGTLPEVCEQEPNDPGQFAYLPPEPPVDLPAVLNGQVMPGDVDRFRFRAKRGQQLVIEASARQLVPFLADAVPGWCQATVALYDAAGREVAFADDYRFRPDPVLFYRVPEDGEYELEMRDAIYRGREDFVYRIAVGELPFITQTFPLGGRSGAETAAVIDGWNLPTDRLLLDTQPGEDRIRHEGLCVGEGLSNEVTYAVDTLPECTETEPNDDILSAQQIAPPQVVNGRIGRAGDVDVFRFEGHAGDEVVAEVLARRLHSSLDSLLRLTDASGRVLEWNDDHMEKDGHLHPDMGLLTHHADSYLSIRLPEDGTYCVQLADAQNHGSDAHAYRLRVGPPRPDFELRAAPASLNVPAGRVAPFTVHALRKDGFEGDVEVALKDAPAGFVLSGGRIPPGRDSICMTLTAPRPGPEQPVTLQLEGRAQIDGQTVTRPVIPSEDMTQAFLYRHLVPSEKLMVAVRGTRWHLLPLEPSGREPVRVPAGGAARVRISAWRRLRLPNIHLVPIEAPDGLRIEDARLAADGLAFQLKVEGGAVAAGFADNLIVEAFADLPVEQGGEDSGEQANQTRRVSLGLLPAVPFVVVQP